ncbi:YktB family protein [Fredinandcohnia quinoae]|uniref:UPF0637 protein MJG50_01240 n=1 Tax=Fredinandcohnia quinoae TaxID=2918902 RepID=A0AAW5E3K9_9BACI|nr:DUF1054 domain-containing protein [Fredinandcohnia sp. SECRCQ15]MCH1623936.1 DUF1054 domain-containing protein [Fredinandcohnia sp. SECRCQ15]
MKFNGFTEEDFDVFSIDGLDNRMDALITLIRPKLEELGQYFAPTLSSLTGDEMFPHVAKHARRTINPPNDTWVAFANNNRGYKMLPHFQIGLWQTHLFVWFAVIYEAPMKSSLGKVLSNHVSDIQEVIPNDFVWSIDHTQPKVIQQSDLNIEDFKKMFERLETVKKAEILCGITINRDDVVKMSSDDLVNTFDQTFRRLIPLYQFAQQSSKIE